MIKTQQNTISWSSKSSSSNQLMHAMTELIVFFSFFSFRWTKNWKKKKENNNRKINCKYSMIMCAIKQVLWSTTSAWHAIGQCTETWYLCRNASTHFFFSFFLSLFCCCCCSIEKRDNQIANGFTCTRWREFNIDTWTHSNIHHCTACVTCHGQNKKPKHKMNE